MIMRKVIFIVGLLLTTNVFADSDYDFYINLDENQKKFISYIENSPMGKRAVWLEQRSDFGYEEWEKVVLVFGYLDDYTNCKDIEKLFGQIHDGFAFRCNIIE